MTIRRRGSTKVACSQLTSRIGKHAHQGCQLGWAATMGNVQPTSGGTMNTASSLGRSGLALLLTLLLLGLLLLLHVEQTVGYKHQYARRVRSMKVWMYQDRCRGIARSRQLGWKRVVPAGGRK